MGLFDAIFGEPMGVAVNPMDLRALSPQEMAERQMAFYKSAQESADAAQQFYAWAAQNYIDRTNVPQGWADWVAIGDELV